MSAAISNLPVSARDSIQPSDIRRALMEDDSPFGVQGLVRESLQILKPECISALAATLALCAKPDQIRDDAFVSQVLTERSNWLAEYQVVHLIEKSLWIAGHSDLVMTLERDPSRILDNPPPAIMRALSQAIEVHPESTVWYGVPLFGEETNAQGLPIPLTAAQVREEARQRIAAAQRSALRWGWAYRAANLMRTLPYAAWRLGRACRRLAGGAVQQVSDYWKRARRDARCRNRARILANSEYCRRGQSFTRIPEHTTSLGLFTEKTTASIQHTGDVMFRYLPGMDGSAPVIAGAVPVLIHGAALVTTLAPLLMTPMTIIACDPFLFIELPDEPGKLRFLGHWYWQGKTRGQQKLHLHV